MTSEFERSFDMFLLSAPEDRERRDKLVRTLQNKAVSIAPECPPNELGNVLKNCRKLVVVLSEQLVRQGEFEKTLKTFNQKHSHPQPSDRAVIPLLVDDREIPPEFENLPVIDFRVPEDEPLRVRQLIEALDLPDRTFTRESEDSSDDRRDRRALGLESYRKGKRFEDEVAKVYELLGFKVTRDVHLSGVQMDLKIEQDYGRFQLRAIVECKDTQVGAAERDQASTILLRIQKELPGYQLFVVTTKGFAAETRESLEKDGVVCCTHAELLGELAPLKKYAETLIDRYRKEVERKWGGQDWYIRPDIVIDIVYERRPIVEHFADWLGDSRKNQLVVLGDLGTGKTTTAGFLAYSLAKAFLDDPLRHPAPVLIPLKEIRQDVRLPGIVVSHFDEHGFRDIVYKRFEHLVQIGRVVLIFDAFDEMADRMRWETTRKNLREISRAAEREGKVVLTCRTHYFKDRQEQVKFIGEGPTLSQTETELYRDIRERSGTEVVYLQEFTDEQIQAYLKKARPESLDEDWKKIEDIYNLRDLAHRPLLLDMIVKSLPKLRRGETINAATLYRVYTSAWIDREEEKGRLLDKTNKLPLLLELAWRMWHEEKTAIHHKELLPLVERLIADKSVDCGDEEAEDVAREMQAASFLKRDDAGNFSFMHRSFMEYFLACKLFGRLAESLDSVQVRAVLNTHRFDRKIIYFLTLLDEKDHIVGPLQVVLTDDYALNVSENALQVLYWSGRIRCGMEETIPNVEALRAVLAERIPPGVKLAGASLAETVLEAAEFTDADCSRADFTKANLNHARLQNGDFSNAELSLVQADNLTARGTNFREANFFGVSVVGAEFVECDFREAIYERETDLVGATFENGCGISTQEIDFGNLIAVVRDKRIGNINVCSPDGKFIAADIADGVTLYRTNNGIAKVLGRHYSYLMSVVWSPDGKQLVSGSDDLTVRVWDIESGDLVRVFRGHESGVRSVAWSPDGKQVASGGWDTTVRVWNVVDENALWILKAHESQVNSIAWSPNGTWLASGSHDRTVRLWNAGNGSTMRVLRGHKGGVNSVAWSPDGGRLASGGDDGAVRVWDPFGGSVLVMKGHNRPVSSVAWSPDGRQIASVGADWTVRIWGLVRGSAVQVLDQSYVKSVVWSQNGKYLIGTSGGILLFWDVEQGELLFSRYDFHSGAWLILLPDGRFDASPEGVQYLSYTERGTLRSFTAEQLRREFHDPKAVREVLDKHFKQGSGFGVQGSGF